MNIILFLVGGVIAGYLVSLVQKYFQAQGKIIISEKVLTTEQKDAMKKILAFGSGVIKAVYGWRNTHNWRS